MSPSVLCSQSHTQYLPEKMNNMFVVNERKTVLGHGAIVWGLQLVLGSCAYSVGEGVIQCTFLLGLFG